MYIVDRHHLVLPAWAELRRSTAEAPRLISLDHHTDTSPSFRRHLNSLPPISQFERDNLHSQLVSSLDFQDPSRLKEALLKLNNDEHVVAAIQSGIISSAFVIAHKATNTDLQTYKTHRIACRSVDSTATSNIVSRTDCDRALESIFLRASVEGFDLLLKEAGEDPLLSKPYILDIDLDYFNTKQSIQPKDSSFFRTLWKNATLVTIATEPDYVTHCAQDPELDSTWLLEELKKLVQP